MNPYGIIYGQLFFSKSTIVLVLLTSMWNGLDQEIVEANTLTLDLDIQV